MQTIILSCEHGGNEIPPAYWSGFKGQDKLLDSHKGWDIGALEVAKAISESLKVKLYFATTSRLLIEFNRSLHHPDLFSAVTKKLSKQEQQKIVETYYLPYRNTVSAAIEKELLKDNEVIHISVHSFTPELNGIVRNADMGLLYDPKRENEKKFCKEWKLKLRNCRPYKIRFNYPYKGTADGFTTFLRRKFTRNYSGIELEINQGSLLDKDKKAQIIDCVVSSLVSFKNEKS